MPVEKGNNNQPVSKSGNCDESPVVFPGNLVQHTKAILLHKDGASRKDISHYEPNTVNFFEALLNEQCFLNARKCRLIPMRIGWNGFLGE